MRVHSFASDLLFGVRDGSSSVRRACVDSSSESFDDVPTGARLRRDSASLASTRARSARVPIGVPSRGMGVLRDSVEVPPTPSPPRAPAASARRSRARSSATSASRSRRSRVAEASRRNARSASRAARSTRARATRAIPVASAASAVSGGGTRDGDGGAARSRRAQTGHPAYAPIRDVKLPEELRAEHVPVRANLAVVVQLRQARARRGVVQRAAQERRRARGGRRRGRCHVCLFTSQTSSPTNRHIIPTLGAPWPIRIAQRGGKSFLFRGESLDRRFDRSDYFHP